MAEFFTGVVESIDVDAEYEGVVYTRWVHIRASNGRILKIFDQELYSEILKNGETCTVIVAALFLTNVRAFGSEPVQKELAGWEGTIVDLNWQAPDRPYKAWTSYSQEPRYALVQTSLGQLLMNRKELPIAANGAFLQWDEPLRFDLYAVL